MKCPECGHSNRVGANFCDKCGKSLRSVSKRARRTTNTGSGAVATERGVAAGKGGAAVGHDVHGGVHVTNVTKVVGDKRASKRSSDTRRAYLDLVVKDCRPLRLKNIDQSAARPNAEPLELASVYVDLNLDLRIPIDTSLAAFLRKLQRAEREDTERMKKTRETCLVPVLEALAYDPIFVLLGAPGSGKSTLGQFVALSLADACLGKKKALGHLGKWWAFGALLPIRVELRKFAAALSEEGVRRTPARAKDLWNFIAGELAGAGLADDACELLKAESQKSGALFLLDGLDETKDPAVRARVCESVAEFVRTSGDKCRFLLTSRPYAWEEMEQSQQDEHCPAALRDEKAAFGALLSGMPARYSLAEFEPEQTDLFIQRWYRALIKRGWVAARDAKSKTDELQAAVRREDLRPLGRNPLLLTLMATVHSNRAKLPDDRADLYNEVVELLLQRWNENIGADRGLLDELQIPTLKLDDLRHVIERLAFEAHAAHAGREGVADIPEGDLIAALKPLLHDDAGKATIVIEYIERRAGLLLGQGSRGRQRQFTLPHRTFQEFLAGCHLASCRDFEKRVVELAEENPSHWREVLKFAARRATASRGIPACDVLMCHQDVEDWLERNAASEIAWRKAVLAAEQMLEIGLAAVASDREHTIIRKRIAGWLQALIERGALPPPERARAGILLAKVGDPRPGVAPGVLEDLGAMEFCYVPAGPFIAGEGEKRRENDSMTRGYWIARFPVTTGQFALFVQDGGYRHETLWAEAEKAGLWKDGKFKGSYEEEFSKGPLPRPEPFSLANHPVAGVSWYEAMAFCGWLNLRFADHIPSGHEFTLPSEWEWEKAARGGLELPDTLPIKTLASSLAASRGLAAVPNPSPERVYPWEGDFGADRANTTEAKIGATSAVGSFPRGASPYGVEELGGNVLEWTRSGEGREFRVLRGGSFANTHDLARCAFWGRFFPDSREGRLGFRVMLSASPFS